MTVMDKTLTLGEIVPAARFTAYGVTHAGRVQKENQDSWLVHGEIGLAVVADGVGGHLGGGQASREAVACLAECLNDAMTHGLQDGIDAAARLARENHVRRAIAAAHDRIRAHNVGRVERRLRSGATIAGVWAPLGADSFATVFHVGDSRVYRVRGYRLLQMTRDHSAYEEWRRGGEIGEAPSQKYILQALGVSERVKPDLHSFFPDTGDRLLICTDGVCGEMDNEEIETVLADHRASMEAAGDALISLGLERGGRDNLTAVLCELHS